jgi:ribosomal protein S27AE
MNKTIEKAKRSEQQVPGYKGSASSNWSLDGCPRCHGDVFLETEDGDLLAHCLQCGYVALGREPVKPKFNPFASNE